ncbi:MAG TPA: hypothetical protein ENI82_02625 [Bacteroidetes bacterium]|nr:hypothetical protein [Bacteroidota bacterium]
MRNNFFFITILLVFLSLTSCFELTEEVDVKTDGSGTTVLTINLNESKEQLKSYFNKGVVEGIVLPTRYKMEMGLAHLQEILNETKGISNVKVESDFEEFIFVFRANFNNVNALNEAINNLIEALVDDKHDIPKRKNFSFSNNQFTRFFRYSNYYEAYQKLSSAKRLVLESAQMVSIYRFEKTIKQYSNRDARLSRSKKAIMMIQSIADLAQGKSTLENKISF